MNTAQHAPDELLAALAGADPALADDVSLRRHVAGCARCESVVREINALRSALAELPDITPPPGFRAWTPSALVAPSRPGIADRFRETLRRAFAPAMLAGASLAIIGAVGVTGVLDAGQPASIDIAAEAPAAQEFGVDEPAGGADAGTDGDEAGAEGAEGAAASPGAPAATDTGRTTEQADREELAAPPDAESPAAAGADRTVWAAMLGGGVLLFVAALVARRMSRPRHA